eukprot:CAMPEP_0175311582 /NCGR_PEP_ID=MMETSP0093-20121207/66916_1 /TAXON_ID=311494 /ORGANISM="Alexandrium monilatum, Strain CCMP3105" /LENGTH=225 /DNA_ID=CAMNT_0016608209 /DNA_START=48 /DNA_END=721 /DNA_ORIENTATION=+
MTRTGSQTVLPAQESDSSDGSPSPAPEPGTSDVPQSRITAADEGASFFASLRSRVSSLLGVATGVVEVAKARVHAAKEEVVNKAAAAKAAVNVRAASALQAVQDARAAAHGYAASARSVVAATCEELRKKGAKALVLDTASDASAKVRCTAKMLVDATAERCDGARRSAVERATGAAELAKTKASQAGAAAHAVATDRKFQTTAASAASGAVALGTTGGATGLAA